MKELDILNDFTSLGLNTTILEALNEAGYTQPTPIQAKAIPALVAGMDLVGIAQTGTGKTAAFALPILHRLAADPKPAPKGGCRVLVLSPTRELASQIAENFRIYSKNQNLKIATVFGGTGHRPQVQALKRGIDVLVATPGRLIDHMTTGTAKLGNVEILVLDEADQMLDLGFVRPIRQIVAKLPQVRQTLLFSATMPEQIARLAKDFLHNPERVSVAPVATTAERVSQRIIHVEAPQKRHLLSKLLTDEQMFRTLVFTRTKHGADRLTKHLQARNITAAAIHGNKSQPQRERALEAFRDAQIQVLVATDIAARGIDIDAVTHVVNYELPEVPEAYVHRIGRTARAGASGTAISFCDNSELKYLRGIERLTRQKIASETYREGEIISDGRATGYDPVATADAEREERTQRQRRKSRPHRGKASRAADAGTSNGAAGNGERPPRRAKPHRGQADRRSDAAPSNGATASKPEHAPRKPKPHRGKPNRTSDTTSERRPPNAKPHRGKSANTGGRSSGSTDRTRTNNG